MTPDEAKVILHLCPPGDETNPDVPGLSAALELAASNPELGTWWEQEKNFEGQFSRKLASLTPPVELLVTIMRGGATIFFASRLIAESTGETLAELPALADEPDSKKSAVEALASALPPEPEPAPRSALTWWWRIAVLSVAFLVMLLLALLFVLPVSSNSSGQLGAQLPDFTHYATQLAALAAPPPSGQTLADMQQYLIDSHAPNPSNPLGGAAAENGAVPISVTTEVWNAHLLTHYIVQSPAGVSHWFILNQTEFPLDEDAPGISESTVDGFRVQTWRSDGFIYVAVKPSAAAR
jgi:hypothetical protein